MKPIYLFKRTYHSPYEQNTQAIIPWDMLMPAYNANFPCDLGPVRAVMHALQQTTPEGLYAYIFSFCPLILRSHANALLSSLSIYVVPYLNLVIFDYGSIATQFQDGHDRCVYIYTPHFARTATLVDPVLAMLYKCEHEGHPVQHKPLPKAFYLQYLKYMHIDIFPVPHVYMDPIYNGDIGGHTKITELSPDRIISQSRPKPDKPWLVPPVYSQTLIPVTPDVAANAAPIVARLQTPPLTHDPTW